jgi:methionine-S-sulfoxide reductase
VRFCAKEIRIKFMQIIKKLMMPFLIILALFLVLWIGRWVYVHFTIETPSYTVVSSEKNIEIRDYDPMIMAQTVTTAGNEWRGANNGFMTVAGYIFGGNTLREPQGAKTTESIAMTAPVVSQKISMTAPVLNQKNDQEYSTAFVMPSKYKTIEDLPIPDSDKVKLTQVPARKIVAYRYTWNANPARNQAAKKKLFDYVEANNLTVVGEPMFAFYNEPWSPPFLRRNEVLLELKTENEEAGALSREFKIVAGEKIPLEAKMVVLAGGCFWCTEANYENQPGVYSAISGYAGGDKSDASYKLVSSGETKHREAVQVWYDDQKISFEAILDLYWSHIDPTDDGGQFADRGNHYRTAIFYDTTEQKNLAEASKLALAKSDKFEENIVTEVVAFSTFFPAEEEHQNFAQKKAEYYKKYKNGSGRKSFIERWWKQ